VKSNFSGIEFAGATEVAIHRCTQRRHRCFQSIGNIDVFHLYLAHALLRLRCRNLLSRLFTDTYVVAIFLFYRPLGLLTYAYAQTQKYWKTWRAFLKLFREHGTTISYEGNHLVFAGNAMVSSFPLTFSWIFCRSRPKSISSLPVVRLLAVVIYGIYFNTPPRSWYFFVSLVFFFSHAAGGGGPFRTKHSMFVTKALKSCQHQNNKFKHFLTV